MFINFFKASFKESARMSAVLMSAQFLNHYSDQTINSIVNTWIAAKPSKIEGIDKSSPSQP